jgi:hypothetical protein
VHATINFNLLKAYASALAIVMKRTLLRSTSLTLAGNVLRCRRTFGLLARLISSGVTRACRIVIRSPLLGALITSCLRLHLDYWRRHSRLPNIHPQPLAQCLDHQFPSPQHMELLGLQLGYRRRHSRLTNHRC